MQHPAPPSRIAPLYDPATSTTPAASAWSSISPAGLARDRRARPGRARQPDPPRRRRRRRPHRRRRGLLTQIPSRPLRRDARGGRSCGPRPGRARRGDGLPAAADQAGRRPPVLEEAVRGRGLEPIGWRAVPIDPAVLGEQAIASMPRIEQLLIRRPEGMGEDALRARAAAGPQGGRAGGRGGGIAGLLRRLLLGADDHLQGVLPPARPAALLPRPPRPGLRKRDRPLPPALLDQHPADLGDGPAVPLPRPQRRDQHRPGQPQLDGGARAATRLPGRRRRREDAATGRHLDGSDSLSLDNVLELALPRRVARCRTR